MYKQINLLLIYVCPWNSTIKTAFIGGSENFSTPCTTDKKDQLIHYRANIYTDNAGQYTYQNFD